MKLVFLHVLVSLGFSAVTYTNLRNDDYVGGDIAYIRGVGNYILCQNYCTSNPQCLAVQYNYGKDCYLKWKYPEESHLDNYCTGTGTNVCDIYTKDGYSSPLSNAFINKGWFIDENVQATTDDSITPSPFDWAVTVNNSCELKKCFAKQRWGTTGLYEGYGTSDLVHKVGFFFATRTAVSNHFTLLQFTEYSGSIQFLTPSYTMSACMTECFHNPLCQYAYFSRNDLKCALLNNIDRSKLIYDMASYRGDMQIVNKTWQYNTAYSALPNYNLITVGGISVNAISADACLRYCTTYNKPACTFNYNANTCIYYTSIDLNDLKNTTNNAMTFLLNSATGAEIVPFFTRESTQFFESGSVGNVMHALHIASCQNSLFCTHVIVTGSLSGYNTNKKYVVLKEDAVVPMGMYPWKLTFKVRSLSYTQQQGYIVQPFAQINCANSVPNPSFSYSSCWQTSNCIWGTYSNSGSGIQCPTVPSISSSTGQTQMLVIKTTIATQYLELHNISYSNPLYTRLAISLAACLSLCFITPLCSFVFYDTSAILCAFVAEQNAQSLYSLTNQYSKEIVSFKKIANYTNYGAFVDTAPIVNQTLSWLNTTESSCISLCNGQNYCYGVIYSPFTSQCSIVNSQPTNFKQDARYVWYNRTRVTTTTVALIATTTSTTAVTAVTTAATTISSTSPMVYSNNPTTTQISLDLINASDVFILESSMISDGILQSQIASTTAIQNMPGVETPADPFANVSGNLYLIVALFGGLIALILVTFVLSKYFKNPKFKSKFDTRTITTEDMATKKRKPTRF